MSCSASSLLPALAMLRDLAIDTLRELMSPEAKPSDRRLAATAALRYITQLERPARSSRAADPKPAAAPPSPPVQHSPSTPTPTPAMAPRAPANSPTPQPAPWVLPPPLNEADTAAALRDIEATRAALFSRMVDPLSPRHARRRNTPGIISGAGAAPARGP